MGEVWLVPDAQPDAAWLKGVVPRDATVLALNVHALVACRGLGGRVTSIEDWVPYGEITALADRAVAANETFVRVACGGEQWDGYDVPAIAWQEHAYFFRDVLLAERLGHALREGGGARVRWAGAAGKRPISYTPTHDAVAAVLRAVLGEAFATAERLGKKERRLLEQQRGRLAARTALIRQEFRQRARMPGRAEVVACFSGNEWARYTDAYADLSAQLGTGFQFWSMGQPYPGFKEWAEAHGTELYWVGYPARVERSITQFFEGQWRAWVEGRSRQLADAVGCEWLGTGLLDFHFRPAFLGTWTHLAQWARTLERYFEAACPHQLVASSDHVPSWSLPRYVAKKLGVQTIALPHTYVPQGDAPIVSDYVACRNRLEAEILAPQRGAGLQPLLARNAANALSYASRGDLNLMPSARRVAMLVSYEDFDGALMSKINRRAFLETFAELMKPPGDLDALQFVYKSHPRADVAGLLRELGTLPKNVTLLDAQCSITDLIAGAWLVVLVNYLGSATLQAAQMGKPMVVLDTAGNYFPGLSRLPLESGKVVQTMDAFWETLRELANSEAEYDALTAQGQAFAREWLSEPPLWLGQAMLAARGAELALAETVKVGVERDL